MPQGNFCSSILSASIFRRNRELLGFSQTPRGGQLLRESLAVAAFAKNAGEVPTARVLGNAATGSAPEIIATPNSVTVSLFFFLRGLVVVR